MGLFKPNIEELEAKKDVEGLIKCLRSKGWYVQDAAEALGKIRDPRAVELMIAALNDKD